MEETAFAGVGTHLTYLALSIALTVWVARTLHRHGRIFLVEAFGGNEPLADSVNHLLVVGFYLVNLGFVTRSITASSRGGVTLVEAIETLGGRVGTVLVVLGAMHFLNLYIFSRLRRRAALRDVPPPLAPSSRIARPAA